MSRSTPPVRAVGVALLALAAVAGPAAAEPERRALTLLVTSGLSGRLVDTEGRTVATLVATLSREARQARSTGRQVVVLDAGRTLAPYAESRFDAGRTMVAVLDAGGCRVMVPDAMDFSVTHWGMAALARQAGFPILRGFDGPAADGMSRMARVDLGGGLGLRLVAVLDPRYAGDLAAAGVGQPLPKDPVAELAALRLDGDIGMAVVHSLGHGASLTSRALTWRVLESPGPLHLILDPDLGHDLALRHEGAGGAVFLLGRNMRKAQPWTFARIDLDVARTDTGWAPEAASLRVVEADPTATPAPDIEDTVRAAVARFRAALSAPLPPGVPTTWEGLRDFVLEALREATGAEVAMLNQGAVRPVAADFFAASPVTLEALGRMLSIDQRVAVVTLSGRQLAELATESARRVDEPGRPRQDSLIFAGLTYTADGPPGPAVNLKNPRVNGRPLQLDDPYTVATNSYLLAGGDDHATLTGLPGRSLATSDGHAAELRDDVVWPRLRRASEPFPDLAAKPLWRYGADRLALLFEGVKASHDPAYSTVSDSRAQAADTLTGLVEARLRADRSRAGKSWENRFRLRFGAVDSTGSSLRETDDVVALDSSLVLNDTHLLAGSSPYAGLTVETEVRRNHDNQGNALPRRMDESVAAGLAWTTPRWPRLRLGMQVRHSAGEPSRTLYGVVGEGQFLVAPKAGRPGVDARLLAETLRSDQATISRVDIDVRVIVPLRGPLAFTPGIDLYAYKDSTLPGVARYGRLTVGLAYLWQGKRQSF
jgi:5'-nucleotidase / UDP-sugar diphosphatase